MTTDGMHLAGFRGARADILVALRRDQPLTARELAGRFGVTANALRRHLRELESAGVVRYRREVRGVGGPAFMYSLTESGERLFPRAYEPLLADALRTVRDALGSEGVRAVVRKRWERLAEHAGPELRRLPMPERAQLLAELLSSHGYMAEAVPGDAGAVGAVVLREFNCATRELAQEFPEVCAAEADFIAEVLGVLVEQRTHAAHGCRACEYRLAAPVAITPRGRAHQGAVA